MPQVFHDEKLTEEVLRAKEREEEFGSFDPERTFLHWCGCIGRESIFGGDGNHGEISAYEGDKIVRILACKKRNIFKRIELNEIEGR